MTTLPQMVADLERPLGPRLDTAGWHLRPTGDGWELIDPKARGRVLYRYDWAGGVRYGATAGVWELPTVPHEANNDREARATRKRLAQIAVIARAFEEAMGAREARGR